MARVQTSSVAANIDWKGDGYAPPSGLDNSLTNQDVNFDGTITGGSRVLGGFDDWSSIRLDQVGANVTGVVRGSIEGTVEWGGGSQEWGGGTVEWGGGSQEWGGGSQEWGGGSQEWGGGTVEWGGGSQEWGGGSQEWGGGSQEWGGGSQEWGGGRGEREMSLTLANGTRKESAVQPSCVQNRSRFKLRDAGTALDGPVPQDRSEVPSGALRGVHVLRGTAQESQRCRHRVYDRRDHVDEPLRRSDRACGRHIQQRSSVPCTAFADWPPTATADGRARRRP